MPTEKDRIIKIMEYENLTPARFAEIIKIQRPALSHIMNGRNNPSLEVLKKILETFKYVDPDWLMFGSGNMMRGTTNSEPDLFSNLAINPPKVQVVPENRREMIVETPQNEVKPPIPEPVIIQKIDSKKVNKIMIFYTDGTYDTFIQEKSNKE